MSAHVSTRPHSCTALTLCHPERSLAESEATRQTESKDPVPAIATNGNARNSRVVVRFIDDSEDGCEVEGA